MTLSVGSLCSGYEGLGLGLGQVLDTELAWVSDIEDSACAVLEARFPGVPNLGDLTVVDWSSIEPVDVLTAGYPCQPFSTAGRRQGANDERHLWPHIANAIGVLRPGLVVLENVAGHLSLGFDTVLGDLADLGYDATWCVVRASDVGACHRRARLFVLAHPPGERRPIEPRCVDATGPLVSALLGSGGGAGPGDSPEGVRVVGGGPGLARGAPADPDDRASNGQRPCPQSGQGSPNAADASGLRRQRVGRARAWRTGLADDGRQAAADAVCIAAERPQHEAHTDADGGQARSLPVVRGGDGVSWGGYGAAIARHAAIVGRPAPNPVDGRGRLNPLFVEWMMMLPEGWVTDVVTKRAAALKLLGNGVVPAQAAYAIRGLLRRL